MRGKIFGYLDGSNGQRLSSRMARHEEWTEAILPADKDAGITEGDTDRRPLMVFALIILSAVSILGFRLFVLQIAGGDGNLALAEGNRTRQQVIRAPRGEITDRNGTILASNQASFDITVIPQQLPSDSAKRQVLYQKVSSYIGLSESEIKTRAEVTCKNLSYDTGCLYSSVPQLIASGVDRQQALMFDQASSELAGFSLDTNPVRKYDDGGLLSVFLGYTGRVNATEVETDKTYGPTDLIGKLGLEKQYESDLRGINGARSTEVDSSEQPVRVLSSVEAQPGNNVVLAVDMNLQKVLSDSIAKQMQASGAKRASGVAVNPKTGEVLAAVSLPSYDNNKFSKGISQDDYSALTADQGQPLFNKVVNGAYPSGSVIKPFGAAAALQEKIVSVATSVSDAGQITVPNKYDPSKPAIYKGWERTTGLGAVNVLTAISRSSDIYFYKVMGGLVGTNEDFTKPLGIDKLSQYYRMFGFGDKTGIDLPSEAAGRVPTPEWKKAFSGDNWYTGDTYNVSVGQGDILVSPLQMVMATAAVANGGTLFEPYFAQKITRANGAVVSQTNPTVIRKDFIDSANINAVRRGMYMAANDDNGTACCKIREQVPVKVAAKTGTAETVVRDDGTDPSLQSKPNAWFEAFAPYDDPKIAIVVLVEHGGEGSVAAAPAAREALTWYFTEGAGQ